MIGTGIITGVVGFDKEFEEYFKVFHFHYTQFIYFKTIKFSLHKLFSKKNLENCLEK